MDKEREKVRELEKQIEALCLSYARQVPIRHLLTTGMFFVSLYKLCGKDIMIYEDSYIRFMREHEFSRAEAEYVLGEFDKQSDSSGHKHLIAAMRNALVALKSVDTVANLLNLFQENVRKLLEEEQIDVSELSELFLAVYENLSYKSSGEERFVASTEAVDYLLDLAWQDVEHAPVVYDPFVGLGNMLLKLYRKRGGTIQIIGNEADDLLRSIATMRLYLLGVEDLPISEFKIFSRDEYTEFPTYDSDRFERIISVVPDEYDDGKSVQFEEIVTFAEHLHHLIGRLQGHGKGYLLVPNKLLSPRGAFRKSDEIMKRWSEMVKSGVISSVVALPKIDFFGQNYSLVIIDKKHSKTEDDSFFVKFIDFSALTKRDFFTKPSLRMYVGHSNENIVRFIIDYSKLLLSGGEEEDLFRKLDFRQRVRDVNKDDILSNDESLLPSDYFRVDVSQIEMPNGQKYEVQIEADPDESVQLNVIADVDRGFNINQLSSKDDQEATESYVSESTYNRNIPRDLTIFDFYEEKLKKPFSRIEKYKIIHLANVQGGKILFDHLEEIEINFQQLHFSQSRFEEKYMVQNGDLLLSGRGFSVKIAVVDLSEQKYDQKFIYSNNFMRIRPKVNESLFTQFLNFYLSSPIGMFHLRTLQTKTTQPLISYKDVQNMNIPKLQMWKVQEILAEAKRIEEERKAVEEQYNMRMLSLYEDVSKNAVLKLIGDK